jgi:hypothetical protein
MLNLHLNPNKVVSGLYLYFNQDYNYKPLETDTFSAKVSITFEARNEVINSLAVSTDL